MLNVSGLLFGDQVQEYSAKGLDFYKRIKPILASDSSEVDGGAENEGETPERLSGRFIKFAAKQPSVWVKQLKASGDYQQYAFDGTASDITKQPWLINNPTQFKAEVKSDTISDLVIELSLDYRSKDESTHAELFSYKLKGYKLKDLNIVNDDKMKLVMQSALVDSQGSVTNREKAIINATAIFKQVSYQYETDNRFTQEVAEAISQVDRFNASAKSDDGLDKLVIRSDLDKKIKSSIEARLTQQQKKYEKDIANKLQEKINEALAKNDLSALQGNLNGMKDLEDDLESLLEQELDNYVDSIEDEQKEEIKQKLKKEEKKLKNKLKGLF